MSYENAKSTKLLDIYCAVCGRKLRDAKSAELGIGPDCRKRYGFDVEVGEEARERANKIIHHVAEDQAMSAEQASELVELGFGKLAARIAERLIETVRIEVEGDNFVVETPFRQEALADWRRVPGRRWDGERKRNVVPVNSKRALWALIQKHFNGAVLESPKGTTVVGETKAAAPTSPAGDKASSLASEYAARVGRRFSPMPTDREEKQKDNGEGAA